jgi:hypothetical protein
LGHSDLHESTKVYAPKWKTFERDGAAASVGEVAKCFTQTNRERVEELLDTLASLGKARELRDGRFVAV